MGAVFLFFCQILKILKGKIGKIKIKIRINKEESDS